MDDVDEKSLWREEWREEGRSIVNCIVFYGIVLFYKALDLKNNQMVEYSRISLLIVFKVKMLNQFINHKCVIYHLFS